MEARLSIRLSEIKVAVVGYIATEASAVEFLAELGRKASSTPHRPELSLERHQYRPHEAERLIAGTKAQSSAAA
jgi:hypothetical protein